MTQMEMTLTSEIETDEVGPDDIGKLLLNRLGEERFGTILADPPWQFQNRTGKVAPEHRRLSRYGTMELEVIKALPIAEVAAQRSHLYLWVPNALLPEGLAVMAAWGFSYKSNIVWQKVRKDGEPDGRGVGFYFRNTTELVLFGVRGKDVRTLAPGRRQVNVVKSRKREHSRKPDELYDVIEACSWGPYLELFARGKRAGWTTWGDQAEDYEPSWATYSNHSGAQAGAGETYAGNMVIPAAAQAGMAAASLLSSEITRKQTIANTMAPRDFFEAHLIHSDVSRLSAATARDAYREACRRAGRNPVHDLVFWRELSAFAIECSIRKDTEGGVVYHGFALLKADALAA